MFPPAVRFPVAGASPSHSLTSCPVGIAESDLPDRCHRRHAPSCYPCAPLFGPSPFYSTPCQNVDSAFDGSIATAIDLHQIHLLVKLSSSFPGSFSYLSLPMHPSPVPQSCFGWHSPLFHSLEKSTIFSFLSPCRLQSSS